MKRYSTRHLWAEEQDGIYTVGLSAYAAEQLGDLEFIELPKPGHTYQQGEAMGSVESFKTISEVPSPIQGTVVEINTPLTKVPTLVNLSPERDGWLARFQNVDPATFANLLSAEEYQTLLKNKKPSGA